MNRLQLGFAIALTWYAGGVWAVQPCVDGPPKICPDTYGQKPMVGEATADAWIAVERNASWTEAEAKRNAEYAAEDEVWTTAQCKNDAAAYEFYLSLYPQGRYANQAQAQLAAPAKVGSCAAKASSVATETFTVNGTNFSMVSIPAGRFMMGSPESEPTSQSDERPQRLVSVSAFQLGQTEVTQGLWQAVMGSNPSWFKNCGVTCPVEQVSWNEVQTFIGKLNALTGQRFRLPSEAEWEYAARAGCDMPFNIGGQCRSKIEAGEANFCGDFTYNGSIEGEFRKRTLPVASFTANGSGLFDMHGNVDEWMQDCWYSYADARSDGGAVESASCEQRVLRGGGWFSAPQFARSADRAWEMPDRRFSVLGFRLAKAVTRNPE